MIIAYRVATIDIGTKHGLIQNCASVKIMAENLFCYQILVTL